MTDMLGTAVRVGKRDDRAKRQQGAAMTGAGTVLAGTGLLAGGIPGAPEPKPEKMFNTLRGSGAREMVSRQNLRHNAREGRTFPRAGITGFRAAAHQNVVDGMKYHLPNKGAGKKSEYGEASSNYLRGHLKGKISEEEKVLRGLRQARKASYGLTLGGGALALAGAKRTRDNQQVRKRDNPRDTTAGTAFGAGVGLAAVGDLAPRGLDRQGNKYKRKAIAHVEEAQRLAPHFGGVKEVPGSIDAAWGRVIRKPKKMMEPVRHDKELRHDADKIQGGKNSARAMRAGQLRGRAGQEKHFAEVFDNTSRAFRRARTPGLLLGAAGAGGMLSSRNQRTPVKKFAGAVGRHAPHGLAYGAAILGTSNAIGQRKGDGREGTAAAAGALGAQAAYQGGGKLAARANDKYMRGPKAKAELARRGITGKQRDRILDEHFARNGIPGARKKHVHDAAERYREAFRSYPKELPGSGVKRALARTHSGRSGDIIGGALTVSGGLLGARLNQDKGKKPVGKAVTYGYQEKRRNKVRTAQLGAGAGIAAYGGSRLPVGSQVRRGVRAATAAGYGPQARSAEALLRTGRNTTRRVTGHAETGLRNRIPGFGTALDAIPAKLRPGLALGGGALLAARAVPTHDVRFVPTGRF